ncbi:MAG: hypothetical protein AAB250_09785 [Bdellovibrionota bacterium]
MRSNGISKLVEFFAAVACLIAVAGCSGGFMPSSTVTGTNSASSTGLTPEQKAFGTFVRSDCNMCHGTRPGDGGVYLYDTNALIAANWLIPGDAQGSNVYMNTGPGHHGRVMTAADRLLVEEWIVSLAAPTPAPSATPTPTPAPTATPIGATPTPTPPPMTKDQFFTATVGPNGSSVNSLISVNRCTSCHHSAGSTFDPKATSYLIIAPNDPAGNLARLKAVKVDTSTFDLTTAKGTLNNTLYQFASGHKAKIPAYSAADLQHIRNYVNMP